MLEYVPGSTLEALLRRERLDPLRLARIIAAMADALHHAHTAGLVHRDLKPSNVLIDLQGRPKICDFGLAVDEEIQRLRRGEVAGTLPYMAPEQVRGETNRLDGRTDIWAIGVILYRGLTGRLPFRGNTTAECFEEILRCEPRPPRQFGDTVPRELERICLRCLSRQMSDRYLTAADLGEDLKGWLATAAGEAVIEPAQPPAPPKGFRNYSGEDSAFFLSLLPGPRGSDGLPESVRFWKSRIESARGDRAFSVGLVYGLSGGGKSSFVKAGLIPQLDPQRVRPIVLDASPDSTEARLVDRASPGRSVAARQLRPGRRDGAASRRGSLAAAREAAHRPGSVRAVASERSDRARRLARPHAAAVRRGSCPGAAPGEGRFLDGHDPALPDH